MHHKRRRPKAARAGCKICHPSKQTFNKKRERRQTERFWREYEHRAEHGDWSPQSRRRFMAIKW
jgi:hypothetical protein